jgi:hypothetical protein
VDEARAQALYDATLQQLRVRWPGLELIPKRRSRLCRTIDRFLRVVTFGGQRAFLSHYATTLGRRIYLPDDWGARPAADRLCTLHHEAVHVAQFARWGFLPMAIVYLLLPVPVGFAAGRAWLEWEAYRETVVAVWQLYGAEAARSPALRAQILRRFTGPDYGWMWVSGQMVGRALDRWLERLQANPPAPL